MKFILPFCLIAGSAVAAAVTYTYDDGGRLIKVAYGNGSAISYAYDSSDANAVGIGLEKYHTTVTGPGSGSNQRKSEIYANFAGQTLRDVEQRIQRMAQVQVWHHIGLGQEGLVMQKAQCLRLHRAPQVERFGLERFWDFRHQRIANFVRRGAIQDQTEGPFLIVLADKDDGAMEK